MFQGSAQSSVGIYILYIHTMQYKLYLIEFKMFLKLDNSYNFVHFVPSIYYYYYYCYIYEPPVSHLL